MTSQYPSLSLRKPPQENACILHNLITLLSHSKKTKATTRLSIPSNAPPDIQAPWRTMHSPSLAWRQRKATANCRISSASKRWKSSTCPESTGRVLGRGPLGTGAKEKGVQGLCLFSFSRCSSIVPCKAKK